MIVNLFFLLSIVLYIPSLTIASDISNSSQIIPPNLVIESNIIPLDLTGLGTKICPVFKPYEETDTAYYYDYKMTRYYFCCPQCIQYFKKNPDFFVQRMRKDIKKYLELRR